MEIKTLKDVFPYDNLGCSCLTSDEKAYKFANVKVIGEHDGCLIRWPGKHKNVVVWWELENGYAVGFNENASFGWSFPVMKMKEYTK